MKRDLEFRSLAERREGSLFYRLMEGIPDSAYHFQPFQSFRRGGSGILHIKGLRINVHFQSVVPMEG